MQQQQQVMNYQMSPPPVLVASAECAPPQRSSRNVSRASVSADECAPSQGEQVDYKNLHLATVPPDVINIIQKMDAATIEAIAKVCTAVTVSHSSVAPPLLHKKRKALKTEIFRASGQKKRIH